MVHKYRIKEHRGLFTIEKLVHSTVLGVKIGKGEYKTVCRDGFVIRDIGVLTPLRLDRYYDNIEECKKAIDKWESEPKYHYL